MGYDYHLELKSCGQLLRLFTPVTHCRFDQLKKQKKYLDIDNVFSRKKKTNHV
jgi:hypothetical protein